MGGTADVPSGGALRKGFINMIMVMKMKVINESPAPCIIFECDVGIINIKSLVCGVRPCNFNE